MFSLFLDHPVYSEKTLQSNILVRMLNADLLSSWVKLVKQLKTKMKRLNVGFTWHAGRHTNTTCTLVLHDTCFTLTTCCVLQRPKRRKLRHLCTVLSCSEF